MSGIDLSPGETAIWKIVQAILGLARGKSNAVGTVTLATGTTTTTVTPSSARAAENVAAGMQIFLQAKTAHAAAIIASVYVSTVGQKTFTITHPSSANTDLTFAWRCEG